MTHTLYAVGGDPYGTMATYRELVNHHVNPFLPGTLHQFAAPEGLPIPWPRNLASAPGVLTLYLLTFFFGSAPALSLYTLAGYILTGTVTFLFARRLTGNAWAALIAGWAFAFYPFAIINGLGHIDNVQGWLLVLAVWRLVELMWHPSRRNGLLAGLAVVLAMWWSPYFILFGGVIYATITIVALASSWRNGRLRAMIVPQLIVALLVLLFLIYLGVLSTAGSAEISVRNHNIGNLYTYAARPLEYLLPDVKNLLFGGDTAHYIETHQHASNPMENMLYLGITVMFLAFVAIISLFLRKLKARVGTVVLMLLLLAVVAIATSMQPEMSIFGTVIPFPSHFISQLTTTWRVYSRFVMVVMLAFSLLAAVGLDVLTRSRGPRAKIAIMCLATIAVPLDLWYQRPNSVVKLSTPGIYKTLARQTPGLVAEYPLSVGGGNLYNDVYYRDVYNMPIITGYLEHSIQELRALSLYNLAYPSTAGQLAALGVRYVIVDASPPDWGWPQSGKPGQGFHLIAHESYASLYEVTARPTGPALATIGPGLMLTNVTEAGTTAWLEQSKGTIALAGQCSHCEGVLSMVLASEAPHPKAIILDSHGHLLAQGSVSRYTLVKVPLNFSKHTSVTLEATREPGTNSKPEEGSGIDIRVTNLEFTPLNGEPDHGNATESGKHGKST
ncbi:MAG TPA: hypothetical protein VGP18_11780 [Solirubrobacteraceae bacterium]|jgi:hypothetical protein|nr:hypothetical protein [Solirubrobacteraceae bacterium]